MPTTMPIKDLDHLLQETLGPNLKIESVTWKSLTDPGENYGSSIYSVDTTVRRNDTSQTLKLVVKLPPPSQYLLDFFNSPVCFWKELIFYKQIEPKFSELQLAVGIEKEKLVKQVPQYYGGRLGLKDPNIFDDQAAIVLENLIPQGYVMQDRLLGLDLEHTELAIKELAKLHAIGIGLKIKTPEFFKDVVMPALVNAANEAATKNIQTIIKQLCDIYRELPEAQPYMDSIEKSLMPNHKINPTNPKPSEPWATIVHADFWTNNMLFKYDDAHKPISIKIVDFQLGQYESGIIDLIFFLLSSTQEEILNDKLDDMIDLYYKSFIDFLGLLKIDAGKFTRQDFDKELNKCAPLKFGQCIMMTTVITATKGTVKNIGDLNTDMNHCSFIDKEKTPKKLLHILEIFHNKKWLAS